MKEPLTKRNGTEAKAKLNRLDAGNGEAESVRITLPVEMRRFKLGVPWGEPAIPFSLGRVMGPFLDMRSEDDRLELVLPRLLVNPVRLDCDWHWVMDCDALYIQNPTNEMNVQLGHMAKSVGIPVWVDWGDDPFTVRFQNPNYKGFSNREQLNLATEWFTRYADVCSVPTETARASFPNRKRVIVIPEACRWDPALNAREKVVSWRGAGGHEEDVDSVLPELCALAAEPEFKDWKWVLFGCPPKRMIQRMKEAINEDPTKPKARDRILPAPFFPTPFLMMQSWQHKAPFVHFVPLPDNPFNRTKPPNAWMEATAAGAAVIGPDLPEWQVPGLTRYSGAADFKRKLAGLMRQWDGGKLHPNVALSRADIYPDKTLTAVNTVRWGVLRRLIDLRDKALRARGNQPAAFHAPYIGALK